MPIYLILIPVIVVILSQIFKIILNGDLSKLTFHYIFSGYGGMPSSHSAFLSSLLTLVSYYEGVNSTYFIMGLVFGLIIVRDALGLRRFIEDQAIVINRLMQLKTIKEALPKTEKKNIKLLTEDVGHTFREVIAGLIFGVVVTFFIILFF